VSPRFFSFLAFFGAKIGMLDAYRPGKRVGHNVDTEVSPPPQMASPQSLFQPIAENPDLCYNFIHDPDPDR
jgi:hypothetical protein